MGVLFDGREIDPADVTVRAAVNQIDPAMSSVPEDHDRRGAHVEFHYGFADRKPFQVGRRFGDDDWVPLCRLLFAGVLARVSGIARGAGGSPIARTIVMRTAGRTRHLMILQPVLVAAQTLFKTQ